MKKILTIAIAAALCLAMFACAKKTEETDDTKAGSADTATESAETSADTDEEGSEQDNAQISDAESSDETEEGEEEPTPELEYSISDFEGVYVSDSGSDFLHVDENGTWEITTGNEESMSGTLVEKDGRIVTEVNGIDIEVTLGDDNSVNIDGIAYFVPTSSRPGEYENADMSVFQGDWYLDGDSEARFYYNVNADGSWAQYERTEEGADQIDRGYTVSEGNNKYTLISEFYDNATSIAEYVPDEDTMYINGDAYSR